MYTKLAKYRCEYGSSLLLRLLWAVSARWTRALEVGKYLLGLCQYLWSSSLAYSASSYLIV